MGEYKAKMVAAAQLRSRIESALADRIPAALSPIAHRAKEVVPSGIDALDAMLHGGVPCGAITELIGAECSGRTSMALAYVSAITQAESVGAWIDVADTLDPETAAANGVELEHLLWVRCGAGPQRSTTSSEKMPVALVPVVGPVAAARHTGGGSPHPRSEGRDMPQAIGLMLHAHGGIADHQRRREKRMVGTPGAPNRPLTRSSEHREEQVNSDRMPPRRGENLSIAALAPRCAEPQPRRTPAQHSGKHERMELQARASLAGEHSAGRSFQALDQALRAADLLLQSGGFRVIVLDLGSTPPELAWRIPLATWFRFRAGCERSQTSLILLTQHPCARSSAELVVRLETGSLEADSRVMTGMNYRAEVERNRKPTARVLPIRKPPQAERLGQWKSSAAWAQARGAQAV